MAKRESLGSRAGKLGSAGVGSVIWRAALAGAVVGVVSGCGFYGYEDGQVGAPGEPGAQGERGPAGPAGIVDQAAAGQVLWVDGAGTPVGVSTSPGEFPMVRDDAGFYWRVGVDGQALPVHVLDSAPLYFGTADCSSVAHVRMSDFAPLVRWSTYGVNVMMPAAEPVAQASVAEEPVAEEPAAAEPPGEELVAEEADAEGAAVEGLAAAESAEGDVADTADSVDAVADTTEAVGGETGKQPLELAHIVVGFGQTAQGEPLAANSRKPSASDDCSTEAYAWDDVVAVEAVTLQVPTLNFVPPIQPQAPTSESEPAASEAASDA